MGGSASGCPLARCGEEMVDGWEGDLDHLRDWLAVFAVHSNCTANAGVCIYG